MSEGGLELLAVPSGCVRCGANQSASERDVDVKTSSLYVLVRAGSAASVTNPVTNRSIYTDLAMMAGIGTTCED